VFNAGPPLGSRTTCLTTFHRQYDAGGRGSARWATILRRPPLRSQATTSPVDQVAALAAVEALRHLQAGLVTRRQALAAGLTRTTIARQLRRGKWVAVHEGVYVGHNGPLSWLERAWAAVLWAEPAALSHDSARRVAEGPGRRDRDDAVVHLAVGPDRRLHPPPGVVVHRTRGLDGRVQWSLGPPRVRYHEAVLDLAAEAADDLAAIAVLAQACGSRRTTADKLLAALGDRRRVARRAWLVGVLTDVAQGTCSVLEHGYLDRVERPHGLPEGRRQKPRPTSGGGTLQDVAYEQAGMIVELDGRVFHSSTQARTDDMDRDLDNAVDHEEVTLRIGYRQVFRDGCATAGKVAAVLARRGWAGPPQTCDQCGAGDQLT
jgi:hypothetical protein